MWQKMALRSALIKLQRCAYFIRIARTPAVSMPNVLMATVRNIAHVVAPNAGNLSPAAQPVGARGPGRR